MLNSSIHPAYRPRVSFDSNGTGYLTRTPAGGVSTRKHVFSFYHKRNDTNPTTHILRALGFTTAFTLAIVGTVDQTFRVSSLSGSTEHGADFAIGLNDLSWHHFLIIIDTTDGTAANRVKVWFDGSSKSPTAYSSGYFTTNQDLIVGSNTGHVINSSSIGGSTVYDVNIADFNHVVNATSPTSTDFFILSASGVLYPKRYRSAYSADGSQLLFNNTSNLGENSVAATWTVAGSPSQSTSVPPVVI